jgi:hypothetical protein
LGWDIGFLTTSGNVLVAETDKFFAECRCLFADTGKTSSASLDVLPTVDFTEVERSFLADGVEFRRNQLPVVETADLRRTTINVLRLKILCFRRFACFGYGIK